MARRKSSSGSTRRASSRSKKAPARYELGKFWLWYRSDRDDWNICWLDGRTTRRKSLGIGGGEPDHPPQEAQDALAEHYLAFTEPESLAGKPGQVLVEDITSRWLTQHVAGLAAPDRYANSVLALERFYVHQRKIGKMPDPYTVASVTPAFVRDFIQYRTNQGVSPPSISRDLKALRGPINWAVAENILEYAPRIADVKGKSKARELEYSPEQVAAILEAAAADPRRRHLLLYMVIFLSTIGRSQAILELDADTQIRKGLIYFNAPGREQTRKRRSVVPIAPTLAPWLKGLRGKVITYRMPSSPGRIARGADPWFEYPVSDVGKSFETCLVLAGAAHPDLGLSRQATDKAGNLLWLPPRLKRGKGKKRPKIVGIGTPNTLRHTIHTFLAAKGVPKAQIDTAAGHATDAGTGDRYNHLRPGYLMDFIAGVEAFWAEVGKFTSVHLCPNETPEHAEPE